MSRLAPDTIVPQWCLQIGWHAWFGRCGITIANSTRSGFQRESRPDGAKFSNRLRRDDLARISYQVASEVGPALDDAEKFLDNAYDVAIYWQPVRGNHRGQRGVPPTARLAIQPQSYLSPDPQTRLCQCGRSPNTVFGLHDDSAETMMTRKSDTPRDVGEHYANVR